jgi:hypothetical protein
MAQDTDTKPSALAKVHLSFEFDKTWHEAKKAVRERTDN